MSEYLNLKDINFRQSCKSKTNSRHRNLSELKAKIEKFGKKKLLRQLNFHENFK